MINDNIWFYWDGPISNSRLKILKDSIYSTRVFNPLHKIHLISNTLTNDSFEEKYRINVMKWSKDIFVNTPISLEKAEKYINSHPRELSDLLRIVLIYKYGGTYIDTDDLCIAPISKTKNIICRSYDPHTSFYNKIKDEDCVPGHIREVSGYDHINMFPRNDCWQNWDANHAFMLDMLEDKKFQSKDDVVYIGGDFSWQSICNETCIKRLDSHGVEWNFRLTLVYLFEDFVAWSSFWDRCHHGGEMCDLWNSLPDIKKYKWGEYKCNKKVGEYFYDLILDKFPNASHLWLHSKDQKTEWLNDAEDVKLKSVSTWILNKVRKKIYEY